MALKQYDATPLQVLTDKQTRQRIRDAAAGTGMSQAAVVRDIILHGLDAFVERHGLGD